MTKLVDYQCKHKNTSGFSQAVIQQTGAVFPHAYNDSMSLAILAMAVRMEENLPFCMLPFCTTVEAESLGANIALGDGKIGPRPDEYALSALEDLLQIGPIDFSRGRIQKVLQACSLLKDRGEKVVLQICGPYSIISCLMDLSVLFKGWIKHPELIESVFKIISVNLLGYFEAACRAGVDIISYADPAGGLNIIGPKYSEKTARLFTVPFLTQVLSLTSNKCVIHLCPKTTIVLKQLALMENEELSIPKNNSNADALLTNLVGKSLVGQACIKDIHFKAISGGSDDDCYN